MSLYHWGVSKAFVVSFYITGILAIIFRAAGLLTDRYMMIGIIMLALATMWLWYEGRT